MKKEQDIKFSNKIEAIFANTWKEKSFFLLPTISYNSKEKELLLAFICFAMLLTIKLKQDEIK